MTNGAILSYWSRQAASRDQQLKIAQQAGVRHEAPEAFTQAVIDAHTH